MNQDFVDLLRAFIDADVRFLVVGAYALAVHGRPRAIRYATVSRPGPLGPGMASWRGTGLNASAATAYLLAGHTRTLDAEHRRERVFSLGMGKSG